MFKIEIDQAINVDPELRERVERANNFLREDLGKSAPGLLSASWALHLDAKGRKVLELTLRDGFGDASEEFTPDELDSLNYFGARAYRLWGILLRGETQRHLDQLHEIVKGWEGREGAQN